MPQRKDLAGEIYGDEADSIREAWLSRSLLTLLVLVLAVVGIAWFTGLVDFDPESELRALTARAPTSADTAGQIQIPGSKGRQPRRAISKPAPANH